MPRKGMSTIALLQIKLAVAQKRGKTCQCSAPFSHRLIHFCRKPLEDKVMLYLDMVEQEALMSERIVNMNGREILRYQQESKTIGMAMATL
jgi:hypothetical protein